MNRICRRLAIAAVAVVAFASAAAAGALDEIKDRGSIRVAIANEIPYGYLTLDGGAAGIAPDVASKVLAAMGIHEIEWVVAPFGSLIPGLKAGRFDMVAASQNILPERCQQVAFSKPNSSYGEGLLVKAGNPHDIHGYDDIKKNPDLKLAIVSGADQLDIAHGVGVPDSQIVVISNNADALSTVAAGRAAAYAGTELTVARLAGKSERVEAAKPFRDPEIDGKPVRSYGAFAFRPGDKDLLAAFNEHLAAFHETPEYAKILAHYGLSPKSIEAAQKADTADLCAGK